jgi:hypothetical protein
VGAHNDHGGGTPSDAVYLFDQASDWSQIERFDTPAVAGDAFGFAVAASPRYVLVGAKDADSSKGAVHAYERRSQGSDLFVAGLEGGNGIWQWATAARGGGFDDPESLVALGPVVHVAGCFQDDLTVGEKTLQSVGGSDLFVSQLRSDSGDWFVFDRIAATARATARDSSTTGIRRARTIRACSTPASSSSPSPRVCWRSCGARRRTRRIPARTTAS